MIRRLGLLAAATLLTATVALVPAAPAGAVVAASVPTPTSVTVFDPGTGPTVYAASYGTGVVFQMPILPGGALGPATPYATGFSSPLGVAFGPKGTLYVADSHPSRRAGRTAGRVWAVPTGGGDAASVGKVVIDELPNGRHNTNGLAVLGSRLYITNGNSTDDGVGDPPEETLSGTLISVPLGARGIVVKPNTVPTKVRVEARGMRNLYDVAFRPGTTQAWIPTNGPDTQDPWGEDLLHVFGVGLSTPRDYGFPGCVYRAGPGGPLDPIAHQSLNPDVTDVCDGTQNKPRMTLGLHVSADGLAFGSEAEWGGDLYIAQFGNFSGDQVVGHQIIRVPVDPNGTAHAPETFLPGGTPLDLTFGPPGTGMYVADFGAGQIILVKPV